MRQLALQVLCLVWICANSIDGIQAALVIDDFEDQTNTSGANTRCITFHLVSNYPIEALAISLVRLLAVLVRSIRSTLMSQVFGVGAARQNLSLSLTEQNWIAVNIKLSLGSYSSGFVAFRVVDSDGTVMRTRPNELFSVTSEFTTLVQPIGQIDFLDVEGFDSDL